MEKYETLIKKQTEKSTRVDQLELEHVKRRRDRVGVWGGDPFETKSSIRGAGLVCYGDRQKKSVEDRVIYSNAPREKQEKKEGSCKEWRGVKWGKGVGSDCQDEGRFVHVGTSVPCPFYFQKKIYIY